MAALARTNSSARSNHVMRAPARWHFWPTHALARGFAFLSFTYEAFAEGQQMARDAHKCLPFAEW